MVSRLSGGQEAVGSTPAAPTMDVMFNAFNLFNYQFDFINKSGKTDHNVVEVLVDPTKKIEQALWPQPTLDQYLHTLKSRKINRGSLQLYQRKRRQVAWESYLGVPSGTYFWDIPSLPSNSTTEWVVATPLVEDIFDTGTAGFAPAPSELWSER